jgi:2-polyprenyl-3-methyl-5-hydroxy-6-metoxy-1,4-benzoquinol methylase
MQNQQLRKIFEANKDGWNKRTAVHKDSDFYNVEAFKAGKSSLNKIELQELGDVNGKSMLHLQCHFGIDTLSWAREGAVMTGVDLSDHAVDFARQLSKEINIDAAFVCCNVYDLKQHLDKQYDIVFTSYGVIGWLPDLDEWASIISYFLKPGGIFYIVEFHPVVWMMDENFEKIKYYYHNTETLTQEMTGTYADPSADIHYTEYSWNHSLGEVVNSLIKKGLNIQYLNEFSFSCYNCFNNLQQGEDGYWRVRGLEDKIPLMFSLKAVKE